MTSPAHPGAVYNLAAGGGRDLICSVAGGYGIVSEPAAADAEKGVGGDGSGVVRRTMGVAQGASQRLPTWACNIPPVGRALPRQRHVQQDDFPGPLPVQQQPYVQPQQTSAQLQRQQEQTQRQQHMLADR